MKMPMQAAKLGLALLLAAAALPGSARAAGYPDKPIRMYVGFSSGSATDLVARTVAQTLSERIGQPVVVDNRTGAGGTIAADMTAKSPPDGYSLLTVSSAIAISPAVYQSLPFSVENDLTPIVDIGAVPTVLLVHESVPVNNLQEFLRFVKERSGKLNYGSSGNGGSIHLASELLSNVAGIRMTHVPYRGNGQAAAAVMAGEVDVLLDTVLLATQSVKSGRVKALAITGAQRSPLLPDVPTFAEQGLPEFEASIFFGVMGPANLPQNVLTKLNTELNETLTTPEVRERLSAGGGIVIAGGSPEEFDRFLRAEIAQWQRVAQRAGVRLD